MESSSAVKSTQALYVGELHPEVNEQHLFDAFNSVGNVLSVRICRDVVSRKSLGYGYVNFASPESAEEALRELNFTEIRGRPCRVMRSEPEPTKRRTGENNLVVKNLDKKVTDRDFYTYFASFGNILSSKISRDTQAVSRGYGFVQFEKEEDAKKALNASNNAVVLGDKPIEVQQFIPKSDRVKTEVPITNLYIKNFPKAWETETVKSLFTPYGEVTSVHIAEDPRGRKFGFVCFATGDEANNALEALNGRICKDKGGVKKPEEETEEDKKIPAAEDVAEPTDKAENKTEEETAATEASIYRLYVSPAQTRTQRETALREKFAAGKAAHTADSAENAAANAAPPGVALYVKNLPDVCNDDSLRAIFAATGEVLSAHVAVTSNGTSRGFGIVTMASKEAATQAIAALHNHIHEGRPLVVNLHEKKEQRRQRLLELHARRHVQDPTAYPMGAAPYGNNNHHQYRNNNGPFSHQMQQQHQGGFQQHHGGHHHHGHMGNNNRRNNNRHNNNAPAGAPPATGPFPPNMLNAQYLLQAQAWQQAMLAQQQQQQQRPGNAAGQHVVVPAPTGLPSLRQQVMAMKEDERRQILGEHIYARVFRTHANEAPKITGMMLEMDVSDLLDMLENPTKLEEKIQEALAVLENAARN